MKRLCLILLWLLAAGAADAAAFRAVESVREGRRVCSLTEADSGAAAEFFPDSGGNCFRLRLAAGGRSYELFPPHEPERFRHNPGSQGMPLLFPFLSIVPDSRYRFEGKTGRLTPAKLTTHNFHGFAPESRWRVARLEANAQSAVLALELTPDGVEAAERQYPFNFRLTARFTLTATRLRIDFTVENRGDAAMPFSLGVHPFFRFPLTAAGRREQTSFRLAARQYWRGTDLWRRVEREPVTPENDPRAGLVPWAGACEHYTDFPVADGWSEAVLSDHDAKLQVRLRAQRAFGCWVLYAPVDQPGAVAVEPYTAIPNAINLHATGRRDTGLTVLPPGGRWESAVEILLENL